LFVDNLITKRKFLEANQRGHALVVEVHELTIILKELFGASLQDGPSVLDADAHDCDFLNAIECGMRTDDLAALLGKVLFGSALGILFELSTLVCTRNFGLEVRVRHLFQAPWVFLYT
jgi:hypothetical protein